jgi:hypothetical protein
MTSLLTKLIKELEKGYKEYEKGLKNLLYYYSDYRLKERLDNFLIHQKEDILEEKIEGKVIIEEFKKRNYENSELTKFYESIVDIKIYSRRSRESKREFNKKDNSKYKSVKSYQDQNIEGLLIETMCNGINLFNEGGISKKELFLLEKIIDNAVLKEINIKDKRRFEKFYCKFKEQCIEKYLEDQDIKKGSIVYL